MSCNKPGEIRNSEWDPELFHLTCSCGASTSLQVPDGNVHTIPNDKEHIESAHCWCNPELVGDFTNDGGVLHLLHKEIQ
jgi:hypothetical protein